jgi:microcystin-dependent protein
LGTDTGSAAAGVSQECTLGEVTMTAGSIGNGVPASGQTLQIAQHDQLFALIGTTFGGDGVATFNLPDLRSVTPDDMTYMICIEGVFPDLP